MLGLRFAARSFAFSRASLYRPTQRQAFRTFSTTPRRLATEVPDDFINAIKHTALFQRLADKPSALKALSDLYALTKEMGTVLLSLSSCALRGVGANKRLVSFALKGLDINSTTPPSQYQMFKLVTNRKFVRAVKHVMEELNAAGLKLNSDVRTSSIGSL
jgi:hypothetical protein